MEWNKRKKESKDWDSFDLFWTSDLIHLHFFEKWNLNWNNFRNQKQPFINCHPFLSLTNNANAMIDGWMPNTIKTTAALFWWICSRCIFNELYWKVEKKIHTQWLSAERIESKWKWNIHFIRSVEKVTQYEPSVNHVYEGERASARSFVHSLIVLTSVLLRLLLLHIYHRDSQAIT